MDSSSADVTKPIEDLGKAVDSDIVEDAIASDDSRTVALASNSADTVTLADSNFHAAASSDNNTDAATTSAVTDVATSSTVAIDAEEPSDDKAVTEAIASDDASNAKTIVIPEEYANDPVARKRIEHGLSPTPSDTKTKKSASSSSTATTSSPPADVNVRVARPAFSQERRAQKEAEDRARKMKRAARIRLVRLILILIFVALLIALIAVFWWVRWGSTNDIAAIQGTWQIEGTNATVQITDEQIVLTDEVSYDYAIDPDSKTIVYKFGSLDGQGRYRLSLDGSELALEDGKFDAFGTLMTDIPWTVEAFIAQLTGANATSPDFGGDGKLLVRVE